MHAFTLLLQIFTQSWHLLITNKKKSLESVDANTAYARCILGKHLPQKWVEEAETNDVEIRGMVMNDHMRLVQTSESRFQQADETLLCRLAWTRYRKTGLQGLCKW